MTTISHLTCEYQTNPLGIDVLRPLLSWQLQSNERGTRQTAYQILVASSETDLKSSALLLWDSRKVESDQSIHVPYSGSSLISSQRVYWKVRVWDETGEATESSTAWWEMGLLERTDWKAQWIEAPFYGGPRSEEHTSELQSLRHLVCRLL